MLFGMVERLEHNDWKGTTGGLPWMQRSLIRILGVIDPRIIYVFVALVVPFYMLFSHRGYLAQYHFFRKRFGESRLKAFIHVYVNHYQFGQVIVDRFAVYGGRRFKFEMDGYDEVWKPLESQQNGILQMSSHIGNYELAGYSLRSEFKRFYALVFLGETETIMKNRTKVFAPNNIVMVPVMPDMTHIFTLNTALAEGHIVSMPADRIFGSYKSLNCRFFGADAKFPKGPFSLAVARDCAVLSVFVMKKDWQTYHIIIRNLCESLKRISPELHKNKIVRQQALADEFVRQLEKVLLLYPTQWFNYYEFWQ